jgi:hypothetical protein
VEFLADDSDSDLPEGIDKQKMREDRLAKEKAAELEAVAMAA